MNVHVFQGPEGHKGDKGDPVCAAIEKHKNNFILYTFFLRQIQYFICRSCSVLA